MATTRHTDIVRTENELAQNIRKATSIDETAPKSKHVRSCIVYTFDHKSSASFWQGMKVQPILADEVQTFKALITIHKVLQDGHPVVLREAQAHLSWLQSIGRSTHGDGLKGYGKLISEYVYLLLTKLQFHRQHPDFNGKFEYEEYISLKLIDDPNEGYETISDMMNLQDEIEKFQKLVFSHLRTGVNNECRISSLVPMIHESYGIYKFVTSMLRAMYHSTSDEDVLDPLKKRYEAQHYRLARFFYECSNIRYLTSLLAIPKLPDQPRDLRRKDENAPPHPPRPVEKAEPERLPTPPPKNEDAENITPFWENGGALPEPTPEPQMDFYAQQQQQMQEQLEAYRRQQELEAQQKYLMEEQMRRAQEQAMLAQQEAERQAALGHVEQQLAALHMQHQTDQGLLSQYDQRIRALEAELQRANSLVSTLEEVKNSSAALEDKVNHWKSKYEALAKLYSQLRQEHLDTLAKFKQAQLKAASAQEAIDKVGRLERELKSKNLELAELIRERDKARTEVDRAKSSSTSEADKLRRELKATTEELDEVRRRSARDLEDAKRYHRDELEALRRRLESSENAAGSTRQLRDELASVRANLNAKEEELEILQAAMDETLLELNDLRVAQGAESQAIEGHLEGFASLQSKKIADILDAILESGIRRIEDAQYKFDLPVQSSSTQAANPTVLQSHVEKAVQILNEFTEVYEKSVTRKDGEAELIQSIEQFVLSIMDIFTDTTFPPNMGGDRQKEIDRILSSTRGVGNSSLSLLKGLLSFRLVDLSNDEKIDRADNNADSVQVDLRKLASALENYRVGGFELSKAKGNLDELVDDELDKVANAVQAATDRLADLRNRSKEGYSMFEVKVHESILALAAAVMMAIMKLVKAAAASQKEIASQFGSASSRTAFYKKNNRWTEGLISAAKSVASATNLLIQVADNVLSGSNTLEQLIVACNEVAASTAQLVISSRVKSSLTSKSHSQLDGAGKEVTAACRALVKKVEALIRATLEEEDMGYDSMSGHELKVKEMEQQVEILRLENELAKARVRLGRLRELSYVDEDE